MCGRCVRCVHRPSFPLLMSMDVRVAALISPVTSSAQVFSMVASSESEKEDWIRAIGRAIVISRTKSWQEDNEEDR